MYNNIKDLKMDIKNCLERINHFKGSSLAKEISSIEKELIGKTPQEAITICANKGIDDAFMSSSLLMKKSSAQISEVIHAAGILISLPNILKPEEKVISTSLGAGNTGRKFDLETTHRIAEYKFIEWKGGPESIRQNSLFKDFYGLAEHSTPKEKYLYVLGRDIPLKFLQGARALTSVLSRSRPVLEAIHDKYGPLTYVRDYYELKKEEVTLVDVSPFLTMNQ